ncbi:uncharacterized protein LOC131028262 [Cryptomeria japonica]|uniref:uncharacterized protein LOC131028262 n=1 Tax=Cryptomeria japonica TaxID=3369 RepID=UPI0027D9EF32|nr:uncharacterized protein LOC131028262 [Cryptomeria japonica]
MSTNNTQVDSVALLQRLRDISDVLRDSILTARSLLSSTGADGIVPLDYIQNLEDNSINDLLPEFVEIENQIIGLSDNDCFREPINTVYNSFSDLAELIGRMILGSHEFSKVELPDDREDVERLAQIIISANHVNGECSICTEPFQLGEDARQMPCHESHIFHTHCLLRWLESSNSCPICRTRLLRSITSTAT